MTIQRDSSGRLSIESPFMGESMMDKSLLASTDTSPIHRFFFRQFADHSPSTKGKNRSRPGTWVGYFYETSACFAAQSTCGASVRRDHPERLKSECVVLVPLREHLLSNSNDRETNLLHRVCIFVTFWLENCLVSSL